MTPTFGTTLSWLVGASITLGTMRFFKANQDLLKWVENLFICLFLLVALTSLFKMMPGQTPEGWWGQ